MSRIRVTIDQLVLKGFEPGQRRALAEGLQGELARALSDATAGGDWARSQRTPVLRLEQMAIAPGLSGGRKFGSGMARGIVKGLKP